MVEQQEDIEATSILDSLSLINTDIFNYTQYLKIPQTPQSETGYWIDGKVYNLDIDYDSINYETENNYVKLKLYAQKLCDSDDDNFDDGLDKLHLTSDEGEPLHIADVEMDVKVQEMKEGVIVNSGVYLSFEQWNTLNLCDVNLMYCVVCNSYTTQDAVAEHIKWDEHKARLASYNPLSQFDLNITRKIRGHYHCAICNNYLIENFYQNHYESEQHINNLIIAKSKAIDELKELHRNENNDRNEGNDRNVINDYKNNDMIVNNDLCDTNESNKKCLSYAAVVKNLIESTGDSVDINYGGRVVKVPYNSWHMIVKPKENSIYCMACKSFYHSDELRKHCVQHEHLNSLKKCTFVGSFYSYFIRKVGQFYHCGACNSLQGVNISEHIKRKHAGTYNSFQSIIGTGVARNGNIMNINPNPLYDNIIINDNVSFVFCGLHIRIPQLHYNIFMAQNSEGNLLLCGLCNYWINKVEIIIHIYEYGHQKNMFECPYLTEFGVNLVRNVRNFAHCAICNLMFTPVYIYPHLQEINHVIRLQQALSMIPTTSHLTVSETPKSNENIINESHVQIENELKVEQETEVTEIQEENKNNGNISEADTDTDDSNEVVTEICDAIEKDSNYEKVCVQIDDCYYGIDLLSYNFFVSVGNGIRNCFLCNEIVKQCDLLRHAESESHIENFDGDIFIEKYKDNLIRKVNSKYHCAFCNFVMEHTTIKHHIQWSVHAKAMNSSKLSKLLRKQHFLNRGDGVVAQFINEPVHVEPPEPITRLNSEVPTKKVVLRGKVLKVDWCRWNGIAKNQCIVCQKEIDQHAVYRHAKTEEHIKAIEKGFSSRYINQLFRKVNSDFYHCVVCNRKLSTNKRGVKDHVKGKKHKSNFYMLLQRNPS